MLLQGPFRGSRHDSVMLVSSTFLRDLRQILQDSPVYTATGRPRKWILFGDSAFPLCDVVQRMVKSCCDGLQRSFNCIMAKLRQCVEWGFGEIHKQFSYTSYWANLRIGSMPVGQAFMVSALLTNCHCTFYGNQTVTYFGVIPGARMSAQEYLRRVRTDCFDEIFENHSD
mmetsp:Transcript_31679/g.49596  ORF Transcript_31679/g.49596 Transcript_31679/m.49596 type:complete len:170 (+) Transcript_31679:651-1160(+)